MAIDYNDPKLTAVETEKSTALSDVEKTYGGLQSAAESAYQSAIDNIQKQADEQAAIQQQRGDLAVQQIEQQRAQAEKDYTKEQSGAYVDWQKQSNPYGAKAEQVASAGLQNSGYSESSQVSMYNTYQYRVTAARESWEIAKQNYAIAIKDAQLQNSSILAEIATKALEEQAALAIDLVKYKGSLVESKVNKLLETEQVYNSKYQDVLDQLYANEELKLKQAEFEWQKQQAEAAAKNAAKTVVSAASSILGGNKNNSSKKSSSTTLKSDKTKQAVNKALTNEANAINYLNKLIASGANKSQVASEISKAQSAGAITKAEAQKLRKTFMPVGVQY